MSRPSPETKGVLCDNQRMATSKIGPNRLQHRADGTTTA